MNKGRYKEEYEQGSDLLWPSEKEDKITRKFYRDLSHLTKNNSSNITYKKIRFFQVFLSFIKWQKFLK